MANVAINVTSSASDGQSGDATLTATFGSLVRSSSIPVAIYTGGARQTALFDATLGAPYCDGAGSECSSGNLLAGRGELGPEANAPNTIDDCTDKNSGIYQIDESNELIRVFKPIHLGDIHEGDEVTVEVELYCYSTGTNTYADIYHTTTPNNPNWILIDTCQCPGGGRQKITVSHIVTM